MKGSQSFDCIVVGKGLIGSAAAKYLLGSGNSIALIGPAEPTQNLRNVSVFASHYDQGRVQRIVGIDPVWTRLNKNAAERYIQITSESGVSFHYPVGCLYVSHEGEDDYLRKLPEQANQFGLHYSLLKNGEAITSAIPDYVFPPDVSGALENAPSGHLNPLQLVKAQNKIIERRGGSIIEETVTGVERMGSTYIVRTSEGNQFRASKVLIAAGAFSNFMNLLPQKLTLELKSETVLIAQVSTSEAERLKNLPSLLYEIDTGEIEGVYAIRPVLYPDGNFYLKIGCNLPSDIRFRELNEIQDWFRDGDSNSNIPVLKEVLHSIIPSLEVLNYKTKRCIISRTKHRKAYIGKADNHQLYVAAGGNGYSAMCSDELGRIAAVVMYTGTTPPEYPTQTFEPIFTN